jgi:hypothetical protein
MLFSRPWSRTDWLGIHIFLVHYELDQPGSLIREIWRNTQQMRCHLNANNM